METASAPAFDFSAENKRVTFRVSLLSKEVDKTVPDGILTYG